MSNYFKKFYWWILAVPLGGLAYVALVVSKDPDIYMYLFHGGDMFGWHLGKAMLCLFYVSIVSIVMCLLMPGPVRSFCLASVAVVALVSVSNFHINKYGHPDHNSGNDLAYLHQPLEGRWLKERDPFVPDELALGEADMSKMMKALKADLGQAFDALPSLMDEMEDDAREFVNEVTNGRR